MRAPHKRIRLPHYWGRGGLIFLCLLSVGPVCAAPPNVPVPASSTPAGAAIPDYGGRDSTPVAAPEAAPNPAAQAGRALEALLLVLAGVVGVVYALKRFGLVQPGTGGKPARIVLPGGGRPRPPAANFADLQASSVTVEASQVLPGGAMLHVIRVPGRTLLLAATGHAVTAVAEWSTEAETGEEAAAFEDYLARAEAPESGIAAANARLRSLLSPRKPEENA